MGLNDFGGDESAGLPDDEEVKEESTETTGEESEEKEEASTETDEKPETDETGTPDQKPSPTDAAIPQSRFKEVVAQRGELREENAQLKEELARIKQQDVAAKPSDEPAFDLDKAYLQIEEHRENGELAEAAKLQRQIDDERQKSFMKEAESLQKNPGITKADMAQIRYENGISQAVQSWPELDENSSTFDGQKAADVDGWTDVYLANGKPVDVALSMALEKVMGPVTPATPEKQESPKSAIRKQEGKLRRDVAHDAPRTSTGGDGSRNSPEGYDIETMTPEQFDALPPNEQEKLLYPSRR